MGSNIVYPPWKCPTCGKARPGAYVKCPADGATRPQFRKGQYVS
jgi:hypothetical protein